MKAIKVIFTLAFAIATCQAKCQTNFFPGYYLKTKTDTVRGFIEYLSESRRERVCIFKATLTSMPVKLYADSIVGYSIGDKQWFEAHTVVGKKNEQIGFLRVLVRGKLSLLTYQSKYFVELNDTIYDVSIRKEINNDRINNADKPIVLVTDLRGLGTLKSLIISCPELASFKISENITKADYIYIVTKYNSCKGSPSQRSEKIKIKPRFSLGIQGSPTLTTLKFGSRQFDATLKDNFYFKGGIFVSCFIPKMGENNRLVVEASMGQFNNYTFFWSVDSNNDLFVKYSYLELPVLLRFGQKFFVDAGINNQLILNQSQRWRIETVTSDVQTANGQPNPLPNWTTGLLLGAGLRQNLLGRSIRYMVRLNLLPTNNEVYRSAEFKISLQLMK